MTDDATPGWNLGDLFTNMFELIPPWVFTLAIGVWASLWALMVLRRTFFATRAVRAQALSEKPAPQQVDVHLLRRTSAKTTIDQITDAYGAKLLDISYVIENHALFDIAFPATLEFEEQRATVTGWDIDTIDIDTLEQGVSRLKVLWTNAVAHAERIGLKALGNPSLGKRALKTAKVVQRSTSAGERQAALQALDGLLIALQIVVPSTTRAELENPSRPQLTP